MNLIQATGSNTTGIAALLVLCMTACSGSGDDTASASSPADSDKAAHQTITLTIGTDDDESTPAGRQITHFAEEVALLSDGAIAIQPRWRAAGKGIPRWDQAIAQLAIDGDLDLAVVPSRAWDALGVTTLTALNTPFLVDSDVLVNKIVSTDIAKDLMSGLPERGVIGLALFPEALRHPFGYDEPLLGIEDYTGSTIRTPYSATTNLMLKALGATPVDDDPDPTAQRGAESSYDQTPAGTATGNVTFYPKVNSLVINQVASEQLSEDQAEILAKAADQTRAWTIKSFPDDVAAARTFCKQAGDIAAAGQDEIASLQRATRPVVEQLKQDPPTAQIIDAIEQVKVDVVTPEPLTSCKGEAAPVDQTLDGVYEATFTPEAYRAAGVTDQSAIDENAGDFTVTFDSGTWSMHQVYSSGPNAGTTWDGTGGYTFDGQHLKFYWSHEPGAWTAAEVEAGPGGSLKFSNVDDGGDAQLQALATVMFDTWKRTGNAP